MFIPRAIRRWGGSSTAPQQVPDQRVFSVIVHADVEGAMEVRRSLSDWLRSMHLIAAGPQAELDRYIGYWNPFSPRGVDS